VSTPEHRVAEIHRELSEIGLVLAGSVSDRTTRCQRAGCHCHDEPAVLHGPYPTWTWRPQGAAVTKTLHATQAQRLGPYVEAHRRLKALVAELERLSIGLIDEKEGTALSEAMAVGKRRTKGGIA